MGEPIRPAEPLAPREDTVDRLFGHLVADPYRWLEDASSERTAKWLRFQEERFDAAVRSRGERRSWERLVRSLAGAGATDSPVWRADRCFFEDLRPGREHPVLCVAGPDGTARILVDPARLAPSGRTVLGAWSPSPDGSLLACQLSSDGLEEPRLHVFDVETGDLVEDPVDRTRGPAPVWVPGRSGYYYVRRPASAGGPGLRRRVHWHRLGTDPDTDPVVFEEETEGSVSYGLSVDERGHRLALSVRSGDRPGTRLWLADLARGPLEAPSFRPVRAGEGADSSLWVDREGTAWVLTGHGADGRRLCVLDPRDPDSGLRQVIGERAGAVLQEVVPVDGPDDRPLLLVLWSREACGELTLHDRVTGSLVDRVALPGAGTVSRLSVRPGGGREAWFCYTDYVTPRHVLRYDASDGTVAPWPVPGRGTGPVPDGAADGRAAGVTTLRVEYPSNDGVLVTMALVVPDDAPDGTGTGDAVPGRPRPVLMRGYGGFGVQARPYHGPEVLAWVRSGGVFAEPHIRGGGERGESWHRAGARESKQQSIDDFHAAARWLVRHGWTTPDRLAVTGTSNGGLLVCAAAVQHPELYGAVSSAAPLLDMVRYERFGLGPAWVHEYGSASVPEELDWLLAYSPYHNVCEGLRYPAVLLSAFDNDTRVDPLHARKMCAALQHAAVNPGDVLLRREDLGHGARSQSSAIGFAADVLTFLAAVTGLEPATPPEAGPGGAGG
ncbi:prolyl oligopeptidase family serine peptidase [Streptomyces glaucosporus]|uniref:prolyl oligopeptidase n=1 Tax=Streptomyces glaucosporus TaxID=284044 RepID=A0ABP5UPC8_9ACTN